MRLTSEVRHQRRVWGHRRIKRYCVFDSNAISLVSTSLGQGWNLKTGFKSWVWTVTVGTTRRNCDDEGESN
jgi:hypothetical protein